MAPDSAVLPKQRLSPMLDLLPEKTLASPECSPHASSPFGRTLSSRSTATPSRRVLRSPSAFSTASVMSSTTWAEDPVAVEDIAPPEPETIQEAPEEQPVLLADVKPHNKDVVAQPAMAALLAQARSLSMDCFEEDCLHGCSKRGGWRVTLLASRLEDGEEAALLAFLVYKFKCECLSIAKLAVPETYRRRGFGRVMIQWAVQHAKSLRDIRCVCLSSLAEAVPFYQRLGFKRIFDITAKNKEEDDELIPGQVYMELRTKKGGGNKSGNGKKRSVGKSTR
eukprot:TRINITY_DN32052_c0_g1_i1.p1 TRINITY_DN32052_c0_g1~~TRINITY_DN32052_c0_g1_i1.p1  ORF type:complete len:298 (-),score=43.24 TRINITY_DN32052_c0_g1_i1:404-1243(-)